jgi:hypothetical protein
MAGDDRRDPRGSAGHLIGAFIVSNTQSCHSDNVLCSFVGLAERV